MSLHRQRTPTVVQFDPDWDDEDIFDEPGYRLFHGRRSLGTYIAATADIAMTACSQTHGIPYSELQCFDEDETLVWCAKAGLWRYLYEVEDESRRADADEAALEEHEERKRRRIEEQNEY